MVTRAQKGISKPKLFPDHVAHVSVKYPIPSTFLSLLTTVSEQKTFKQAMSIPAWQVSMKDEYVALRNNETWDYVAPEPHMNILGSKWVYKVKQKSDGIIDRLKSRLVAKGYDQQDDIDYNETFSPLVKSTTVRVVLCIAITYNCSI
ncbi:uncharacterized protein LOC113335424, partial [Papaver somniferum]|uniref:uncharacterized protein LOC113335424 n=1 Tax=Papaver somniferum TaxID=3469 RepID=UPI000E6F9057